MQNFFPQVLRKLWKNLRLHLMAHTAGPDEQELGYTTGQVVRAVMALRGYSKDSALCPVLKIEASGVSARFKGQVAWRLDDLRQIARWLDVPPKVFQLSPDDALDALRSRCLTLEAVASPPVVQPEMFPERPRIAILSDAS